MTTTFREGELHLWIGEVDQEGLGSLRVRCFRRDREAVNRPERSMGHVFVDDREGEVVVAFTRNQLQVTDVVTANPGAHQSHGCLTVGDKVGGLQPVVGVGVGVEVAGVHQLFPQFKRPHGLFVGVGSFTVHQLGAVFVTGCAQHNHVKPKLGRPALARAQSKGGDICFLEQVSHLDHLVPGLRDFGAHLLEEPGVVEETYPVEGQGNEVFLAVVGARILDDRRRELLLHVVLFPDIRDGL